MSDDTPDGYFLGRGTIQFSLQELNVDNLRLAFTGADDEEPEESVQPNFSETVRKVRY